MAHFCQVVGAPNCRRLREAVRADQEWGWNSSTGLPDGSSTSI
jgi:hypothetical protein